MQASDLRELERLLEKYQEDWRYRARTPEELSYIDSIESVINITRDDIGEYENLKEDDLRSDADDIDYETD